MYNIKLSIIVPVYNVELYIEKCLRSLANQDLSLDEYEILAVDDGSPDNSFQIVERLQQEYSNIILLRKVNGGLSSARNYGIRHARGEYIMFVDSDDYIEENVLACMIQRLYDEKLDYLGYDIYDVRGTEIKNGFEGIKRPQQIISGLEYIRDYQISISACTHIARTDVYRNNNLFFKEGIIHEDYEFVLRMYRYMQRMRFINLHVYNYIIKTQGTITSIRNREQYLFSLQSWCEIIKSLQTIFSQTAGDEYSYYVQYWLGNYRYIALNTLLALPLQFDDKKKIYKEFRGNEVFALKRNLLKGKRRIRSLIYRNPTLYYILMFCYRPSV